MGFPVGAQVFPDGDAEQTPIMHLDDFLTESFLSHIKDKQENGAKILKFSNSHKRKRERDKKREKKI
jgi:hypothetical protein